MRKKTAVFVSLIILGASSVCGQQPKGYYHGRMKDLQRAIEKAFYDPAAGFYKETVVVEEGKNPYSYLWPLCGMIQAANEIEKASGEKGLVDKYVKIIQGYYDPAPPAPGYASYVMKLKGGDRFYDDNQWIGIAAMDAYSRSPKKEYLNLSREIYTYMMTGFDTVTGGGLYWQENKKTSKNTCSNGPGVLLALQLYGATRDKKFLDTALLLYNWVTEKLKAPNGLYYDNVRIKDNRVDKRMYSYNTGTMLQSALYLYEATKDKKYLSEAVAVADSAVVYFNGAGKFRDSYWFNAVLLRGYQHLLKHHADTKYIAAFKACVDEALRNNVNPLGVMGANKPMELVPQSGMLEILARFAWLEAHNKL